MPYRVSKYIDFNTGEVFKPPMVLVLERPKPTDDDKLDLFESRVEVWQFGPAVEMLRQNETPAPQSSVWAHAAYAVIATVLSYFEMIGKTLNPTSKKSGTSVVDFNYGFCDVYPKFAVAGTSRLKKDLPDVAAFYDRARNGMYHLAYTKRGLFLHMDPLIPDDFTIDRTGPAPKFLVNPHTMVRTLVDHFSGFMHALRSTPTTDPLRKKFSEFFDDFH